MKSEVYLVKLGEKKASADVQKSLMTQATWASECPNIEIYGNKVIWNYQCFGKIRDKGH